MNLGEKIYFVTAQKELFLDLQKKTFEDQVILSLSIGKENDLSSAYDFFSKTKSQIEFCVAVKPSSEGLSDDFAENISSFFFLPFYHFVMGMPVIFISSDDNESYLKASAIIERVANDQGYEGVRVHDVSVLQVFDRDLEYPKLVSRYKSIAQSEFADDYDIVFRVENTSALYEAIGACNEIKSDLKKNYPRIIELLVKKEQLNDENRKLQNKLSKIEKSLNDQAKVLDVLRSNHQAKELLDHYTREYEVLPLWYKRFGHIIKVIMGERTFRSLFNDNVKKYKD